MSPRNAKAAKEVVDRDLRTVRVNPNVGFCAVSVSLASAAKVGFPPGATDARVHIGREVMSKMTRLAEEPHGNLVYIRYRRLAAPS